MNKIKMLSSDIVEMDARFRAAFVNSLSGFKSASLIGTINSAGISNLSIFSSVLHIGSDPALIGCIVRPDSSPRHTLSNILAQTYFTVNHVNEAIFKQAHQTSARYAENISEFSATGLTEEFSELFKAPYVKESNLKYGVEFVEKIELAVNGTILVIGKIVEVILPENCLLSYGAIDIEKAETIAVSGLDTYHRTQQLARLSYAKPDGVSEEKSMI